MDNEIDKAFLQSMMSNRKASISVKDNTAFSRVKRKLARENQESKRKKKWEDESASCSAAVLGDSTTSDSSFDDEMSLCSTTFTSSDQASRSHKRSVKTGVGVHLPHNILKVPNVVQALVRNKTSSAAISAVMHEIVATSEGDPSKLSLSYASTERYRIEAIQNITEKIAENWTPSVVANIHWDGKLMDRGIRWSW